MSDVYTVVMPEVTGVTLGANPVAASASLTVVVSITEKTVALEPYSYLSGEAYAGEV